jgi:hypothetical protein
MNELNYATLEASQRLQKKGIVLETEFCWAPPMFGEGDWYLHRCFGQAPASCIPAPSMEEVWRELPFQSYIKMLDEGSSLAWIFDEERKFESPEIWNTNPTDALIDLLIWVTEQRKEKV